MRVRARQGEREVVCACVCVCVYRDREKQRQRQRHRHRHRHRHGQRQRKLLVECNVCSYICVFFFFAVHRKTDLGMLLINNGADVNAKAKGSEGMAETPLRLVWQPNEAIWNLLVR